MLNKETKKLWLAMLITISIGFAHLSNPALAVSGYELGSSESQFVTAVNAHRASIGVGSLSASGCLKDAALEWSQSMANSGTLSHGDFGSRISAHCGGAWAEGETALYSYGAISGSTALSQWLNSPPHKAILESSAYNYIGIGMFYDSAHNLTWATADVVGCSAGCSSLQKAPSYSSNPSPSPSPSPSPKSSPKPSTPAKVNPPPPSPPPPPPTPPSSPILKTLKIDDTTVDLSKPITFRANKPLVLSGTTVPNGIIVLIIHSTPQLASFNADGNGNWSYTLTKIAPGSHYIEAAVADPMTHLSSKSIQIIKFNVTQAPLGQAKIFHSGTNWQYFIKISLVLLLILTLTMAAILKNKARFGGIKNWLIKLKMKTPAIFNKNRPI